MSLNSDIILPFDRSHAFIIGINEYENVSPLRTAVNDAKGIAERLEAQHGYEVHGPLLNASKADLKKLFHETMPQVVGEEDRVLFYFAGHGVALDGEDGPNGYLVPVDCEPENRETLVPMDDLHQVLKSLPCKHGLLVLDCCFSGAFKWSSGYRDLMFELPNVIYEERFWRYTKDPAWQVITSSAYDQKALDSIASLDIGAREEGSGIHSPFALSLFKALEGEADVIPVGEQDGVITASELYAYLRDDVETVTTENVQRQSPSMFSLKKHDKGEFIFLNPKHRLNLGPTPDRNPFVGLKPYESKDAAFFFGRDKAVKDLKKRIENKLTVVSGASGTGKSSLIKAGLIPKLSPKTWTVLPTIYPGENPWNNLTEAIPDISSFIEGDKRLLLFVDQYEQLVTHCKEEEARAKFEQQLADWLNEYSQLHIVLSVRSSDEPKFKSGPLAQWWEEGFYDIPKLSQDEIGQIIQGPAEQSVLFYEPAKLVNRIIEDVSQAPGKLPLLSMTLSELYEAYIKSGREDRALTMEDYDGFGGVGKLFCGKMNAYYEQRNTQDRHCIRKLMMRMVNYEEGTLMTRRVYEEELIYAEDEDTSRVELITQELVDARILRSGVDSRNGYRRFVELAHHDLIDQWPTFQVWVNEVGEKNLILHNELWRRVTSFLEMRRQTNLVDQGEANGNIWIKTKDFFAERRHRGKTNKLLWNREPRLDMLVAELATENHHLNAKEQEFVQRSVERRKILRRNERILGIFIIILLSVAALYSYNQKLIAQEERDTANYERDRANQKAIESKAAELAAKARQHIDQDPTVAMNLALTAYNTWPSTETVSALRDIWDKKENTYQRIFKYGAETNCALFSPNGKNILAGYRDGSVAIWDVHSGDSIQVFKTKGGATISADYSPDGKLIVIGLWNKKVEIREVESGKLLKWFENNGAIKSVQFSPDGKQVIVGSRLSQRGDVIGIATLWDVDLAKEIRSFNGHDHEVTDAKFSPDGKFILTCSKDLYAKLWSIDGGEPIQTFGGYREHKDGINTVAFSPTGDSILTGSRDGKIKLWVVGEGKRSKEYVVFNGNGSPDFKFGVLDLSFSPDGRYIAAGSSDKKVSLWDVNGEKIKDIYGYTGIVNSVSFSKDGNQLLTGSIQGAKLVDISKIINPRSFGKDQVGATDVAFSPAQRYLAVSYDADTTKVLIWDSNTGKKVNELVMEGLEWEDPTAISFSPSGDTILVTYEEGTALLWDVNQGDTISGYFDEKSRGITSIAYLPDGKYVLLGLEDGTIKLWDIIKKQIQQTYGKPEDYNYVNKVAFSSDRKLIFAGTEDGFVNIWGIEGDSINSFKCGEEIEAFAFSIDKGLIATSSDKGGVELWNLNGDFIKFFDHNKDVLSIGFSPDGKFLATGSNDRIARMWDIERSVVIRKFEYSEYESSIRFIDGITFSPDGQNIVTISSDAYSNSTALWDASLKWPSHIYKLNEEERQKFGIDSLELKEYGITIDY